MKRLLLAALLLPGVAFAAKTPIQWAPPSLNNDGTPLIDLAGYRVTWGDCSIGTYPFQAKLPASATSYTIVSSGIAKLCIVVYAVNAKGVESMPTNTLSKSVTTLGRPQTLGQPVQLP